MLALGRTHMLLTSLFVCLPTSRVPRSEPLHLPAGWRAHEAIRGRACAQAHDGGTRAAAAAERRVSQAAGTQREMSGGQGGEAAAATQHRQSGCRWERLVVVVGGRRGERYTEFGSGGCGGCVGNGACGGNGMQRQSNCRCTGLGCEAGLQAVRPATAQAESLGKGVCVSGIRRGRRPGGL